MSTDLGARLLEQIEIDYETAHGQVAGGFLDPAVSAGTKILAAAIVRAGAEIALAISRGTTGTSHQAG